MNVEHITTKNPITCKVDGSYADVAVIGKDITDAILLEETHHILNEAPLTTGGKRG